MVTKYNKITALRRCNQAWQSSASPMFTMYPLEGYFLREKNDQGIN